MGYWHSWVYIYIFAICFLFHVSIVTNLFSAFSHLDFRSALLSSMKKKICWDLHWSYIYYVDEF